MDDTEQRVREAEALARNAGLHMDEKRLERLAGALERSASMVSVMEQVDIEPMDLSLEPYDPAWSEAASR